MSGAVKIWVLAALVILAAPAAGAEQALSGYVLGPNDQISINLQDVKEIEFRPARVDMSGSINLPYAGRLKVEGLTVEQTEQEIIKRLKTYVQNPVLTVEVTEFGSQPVSVLGAVQKPGVHQLRGHKTLFEVLSLAEGLRPDAGNTLKVTRPKEWGPIPLATARVDSSGEFSVAELSVRSIMEARNPQENIVVRPHDVISVPRAQLIYVVGCVRRPGGFVLGEKEAVSVLQAISLAEGLDRAAAPDKAKILRGAEGSAQRTEIAVDVKKLLENKGADVPLQPNDVLFIPNSAAKSAALRSLEAGIQMATGVVIWRR
jgi:polysaccharide export outer membrane protein